MDQEEWQIMREIRTVRRENLVELGVQMLKLCVHGEGAVVERRTDTMQECCLANGSLTPHACCFHLICCLVSDNLRPLSVRASRAGLIPDRSARYNDHPFSLRSAPTIEPLHSIEQALRYFALHSYCVDSWL
jgi:hypothetical protein